MICMRDMLRVNYVNEIERLPPTYKLKLKNNAEFYAVVKLALLLTNNCVA